MKTKYDIATLLFEALKERLINKYEQIKIELDDNLYAVVLLVGTRVNVNLFANKYINFPTDRKSHTLSKIILKREPVNIFDMSNDMSSPDDIPSRGYEIISTVYINDVYLSSISLDTELIFNRHISHFVKVRTPPILPFLVSTTNNIAVYGYTLVGGVVEKTNENIDAFNFALGRLPEVIDFNEIK